MQKDRAFLLSAIALALTYALILSATAPAMGYTRDEGYYFKAAEQYGAWWDTLFSSRFTEAFTQKEIDLRFSYNTEHPAFIKLLQGITFRVMHKWLALTGPAQGFRWTGFLFAGLSLLATFLLARKMFSATIGLAAALLLATLPRYFYDAHLACFDVPITAMWTLSLWTFWRALDAPHEEARRRSLLAGVVFGLALSTKLNAMFLPPIFVLAWLHKAGLRDVAVVRGPSGSRDVKLPPVPWALVACAVIGPLLFVATNPYLWHDTIQRIGAYLGFHLGHEHYPIRYFDQVYVKPPFPWHFSWMMTLLTVPAPIVALGALGFGVGIYRAVFRRSTADFILVISVLLPIGLISMPGTPIFGGVKHWYNAMPALCILAARTIAEAAEWAVVWFPRFRAAINPIIPLAVLLAAMPGVLGIRASHPNGIAFYNELAGGIRGGAELGMQRSFWGGLSRPLMPTIGKVSQGTRVFFDHTNYDAFAMYVREGILPPGISFANGPDQADGATIFEDREGYPQSEVAAFSRLGAQPIGGVYVDEVTLVQLYGPPAVRLR